MAVAIVPILCFSGTLATDELGRFVDLPPKKGNWSFYDPKKKQKNKKKVTEEGNK